MSACWMKSFDTGIRLSLHVVENRFCSYNHQNPATSSPLALPTAWPTPPISIARWPQPMPSRRRNRESLLLCILVCFVTITTAITRTIPNKTKQHTTTMQLSRQCGQCKRFPRSSPLSRGLHQLFERLLAGAYSSTDVGDIAFIVFYCFYRFYCFYCNLNHFWPR